MRRAAPTTPSSSSRRGDLLDDGLRVRTVSATCTPGWAAGTRRARPAARSRRARSTHRSRGGPTSSPSASPPSSSSSCSSIASSRCALAEKPAAGLGRLDAAAGAVEELQCRAASRASGSAGARPAAYPELLGGLREAPALDDREERGELARIHKGSLCMEGPRKGLASSRIEDTFIRGYRQLALEAPAREARRRPPRPRSRALGALSADRCCPSQR